MTAVLDQLHTLPKKDLLELRAKLGLLLDNESPTGDGDLEMVYAEIVKVMKDRGQIKFEPLKVVLRQNYAARFKTGAKTLVEYVNLYLSPKSKVERMRGINIVIDCLVQDLRNRENPIPITFKTLADNLGRADEAVESAFPLYRSAGLLRALINSRRMCETA